MHAEEFDILLDGISFIYDGSENSDIDLVINVGDTVRWNWVSGFHNVVSSMPSGDGHGESAHAGDGHDDNDHMDDGHDEAPHASDGHGDDAHAGDAHGDDAHVADDHGLEIHGGQFSSGDPTDVVGTTFDITFMEPGVYNYHCHPHESVGMISTITVVPEPSSQLQIILGTVVLFLLSRRSHRQG